MTRAYLHSVDQIVDMLRARIDELVTAVWGLSGTRENNDLVCLSPLRPDRRAGSFRVVLKGKCAGMVIDHALGKSWSPLSFTAELKFGGDNREALRWARAWLGLDGTDPASFKTTQAAIARSAAGDDDSDEREAKYRGLAHRSWLEGVGDLLDTPVDRYLRGRGLDLRRFQFPLGVLRYHPALYNAEARRQFPAMVAAIVGVDGKFLAAHRTWLEVQADGRVVKAPLEAAKKVLGSFRGGTIRLWSGLRVDDKTGEISKGLPLAKAKAGAWVDITEGIEDGLSVAIEMQERRVLAGVSVGNMRSIGLPDVVAGVRLWPQNDPPGSQAAIAFERVVEHFLEIGRDVELARVPAGVKDANEWLQRTAADSPQREVAQT